MWFANILFNILWSPSWKSLGNTAIQKCYNHVLPGWVVSAPGYPEEVIAECIPPEGYPDNWSYEIWLKGRWSNLANVGKCLNPNLCYDDPPTLPPDFSVDWNQTNAKPNTVNTTLNYTCGRKCELLKCWTCKVYLYTWKPGC